MKSEKRIHNAIRVYITERCNANCKNCFNANSRSNKEMSLSDFEKLCEYLKFNNFTFIKIMGGEPTIHPDFIKIVQIAQTYFEGIAIFSNGTTNSIGKLTLRDSDSVVYNFNFSKLFSKEKMYFEVGGKRVFEVQVKKDTDEKELIQRIKSLAKDGAIKISLTLDCTANIFTEKNIVLKKLKFIEEQLITSKLSFSYDHKIPLCYLYKTGLHTSSNCTCSISNAGLIGADLTLKFCNQYPNTIISLKKDEKFIPWNIVDNYITKSFYEIRARALNEYCLDCVFFNKKCNGGCWIPKSNITKEDIFNNTSFPLK